MFPLPRFSSLLLFLCVFSNLFPLQPLHLFSFLYHWSSQQSCQYKSALWIHFLPVLIGLRGHGAPEHTHLTGAAPSMLSPPWETEILIANWSKAALSFSLGSLGIEWWRLMQWCHQFALWTQRPCLIYVALKSHLIPLLIYKPLVCVITAPGIFSANVFALLCIIQDIMFTLISLVSNSAFAKSNRI